MRAFFQEFRRFGRFFLLLAVLGIAVRFGLVLLSGDRMVNSISGGGDADAYTRLERSLYNGNRFSYVGQPTAFRPPLYPLFLTAVHFTVGKHFLLLARFLQLLAGVLTAWVCSRAAIRLWGPASAAPCFALVLIFPTLIYFTSEILTETFASLMAALFFYFLVRARAASVADYLRLGVLTGISALLRFNMVFLPVVAAWSAFSTPMQTALRRKALLAVTAIPLLILTPWFIRNLIVFHGQVLYSTHTGMDLVEGIIEPEGRADHDQQQQIIKETTWVMQGLESEDNARLYYPPEPELNKRALRAAIRLWSQAGWRAPVLWLHKLGYFWLSTDQLTEIAKFSPRVRLLRMAGVVFYWCALVAAAIGLRKLFRLDANLAQTIVLYLVIATGLHLLFAMNTRLRVPLVDPLICILASSLLVRWGCQPEPGAGLVLEQKQGG